MTLGKMSSPNSSHYPHSSIEVNEARLRDPQSGDTEDQMPWPKVRVVLLPTVSPIICCSPRSLIPLPLENTGLPVAPDQPLDSMLHRKAGGAQAPLRALQG